jgi:hypothetical protein
MTTKLTLTVEESTIKKAKAYAKHTGRSLSELIENYLETLVEQNNDKEQLSPKLKQLIGIVKLPENFDEKKELNDYYANKHL